MKGETIMEAIKLMNLAKTYRKHKAVQDISLEVKKGELFGFLGPNGAGKTTTIKMLTGLLEPSSGIARIVGIDIWKNPLEAKKHIAYVPDQPNIYPKLTGWDYLEFIASVYRMPKSDFQVEAKKLLEMFGLTECANDLIESYSHGMKQKIAMCGAFVHRPDVLFLDEPTVGLDPKSARALKNLLRQRCDQGMTAFLSTHILEIAEQMCDRIGIIFEGNIIALGTMEELRSRGEYANKSLEDIFLELTGGEDHQKVIQGLTNQGDSQ